ncbi:MAG: hypothetical protein CSB28_00900 [Desulfobacterales bacterium]|nr:MAG: hypothetical protein CSB28_00900 [Desulfobacterales bacterium]
MAAFAFPCGVCRIRLRVLLPPFLRSGCLASGILLVARKLVIVNENQMVIKLGGGFRQNATCGVGCVRIPLRRMQIRLRVLLPPFLRSGCLASGILLVIRKLAR